MTFQSPLFLLGTVLAAAPVIIHLWYRRKLRKRAFPTLRFLGASEAQRFGWLKLRELLILAARCLFVVFLFAGLARPVLQGQWFALGRRSSVLLVLDNSYSMAYGDNFERMKDLGQQVLARYSLDSEFLVLPLCPAHDTMVNVWQTKHDALDGIAALRLSHRGGTIAGALARDPARRPQHEIDIVYVGDGQVLNFRDLPVDQRPCDICWVPVRAGTNIGITAAALRDPAAVVHDQYTLQVTLSSYSPRAWTGRLGVASGGHYTEKDCRLEPFATGRFDFDLPARSVTGKVTLFDDSLDVDNVRYFAVVLPPKIRVLLAGDSPYLAQALESSSVTGGSFEVHRAEGLAAVDLRRYDVIVLSGRRDISASEHIRLVDFQRRSNTGIVIILADTVGADLREFISGAVQPGTAVAPKGYVTLQWIALEHPVFAIFSGSNSLQDVRCYRYLRVAADAGVLARLNGGDPFLVVRNDLAVFSTALTPQHTTFVHSRAFVPVMLRLMVDLVTRQQRREYRTGDSVVLPGTVRTPSGELLRARDVFSVPGFHISDGETLAVNVLPDEGDLRVLGPERARALGVRLIDPQRDLAGSDLSKFLLTLALLAILIELLLVWLR